MTWSTVMWVGSSDREMRARHRGKAREKTRLREAPCVEAANRPDSEHYQHPDGAALGLEAVEQHPPAVRRPGGVIDAGFGLRKLEDGLRGTAVQRRDPERLVCDDVDDPGRV